MLITNSFEIIIDHEAYEGVKRVANVLASDIELVTGIHPDVMEGRDFSGGVLVGTLGKSPLIDQLVEEGLLDVSYICNKREVFMISLLDERLVICGSDKRGTIYGMFTLSEYLGITPLVFWGDALPEKRENVEINKDICMISREPSVKYRGFFINDEWPCFGTWATTHYGDFNAKMYEQVFLFLLRMKGNYLWPAMWTASFPLDGPGSENEILADIYGVIMGYSHHEPCLRASEEWDKVKGEDTPYGTAWDFYSNEEGLINYWRDGLKRSGRYENIITIGMRGERDSAMLADESALSENIEILKRIIHAQRNLIQEEVNQNLKDVPQMLALYKEVEPYFYGNENIKGLKDWEELDDVICMLCEDNHGNMRTLPTEDERKQSGGYGMYYHLDYHGGPVSYEWVDSTPLTKIWDQMCMAYEYGVRSLWIVNAGDVKFHELPLSYFMALAYDYDTYGISNFNSANQYIKNIFQKIFPDEGEKLQEKIREVFFSYINLNYLRRPESNHSEIYHPCHFYETDRMIKKAEHIEHLSEQIITDLNDREKNAYFSMIHYPAMTSMNLLKMHLFAGKNHLYARQNKQRANLYKLLTEECIRKDTEFIDLWKDFLNGKWHGMQLASHVGFTKWNDEDAAYPVLCQVTPGRKPCMIVSRADEKEVYGKIYGGFLHIKVDDFCYPDTSEVIIDLDNTGTGPFTYIIVCEKEENPIPKWLNISSVKGCVEVSEQIILSCNMELLTSDFETCVLPIKSSTFFLILQAFFNYFQCNRSR